MGTEIARRVGLKYLVEFRNKSELLLFVTYSSIGRVVRLLGTALCRYGLTCVD